MQKEILIEWLVFLTWAISLPLLLLGTMVQKFSEYSLTISIIGVIFVVILPAYRIILWLYNRRLYHVSDDKKLDIQSISEEIKDKEKEIVYEKLRCTICGKHPMSKKYHLKKIHNLHNVNTDDYFVCCGCSVCVTIRNIPICG